MVGGSQSSEISEVEDALALFNTRVDKDDT